MPYEYRKNVHHEPGREVEIFESYLRDRGLKLTKARQDLLNLIFDNHAHFTADELFDQARARSLRVSKATVYRTITILLDCNLLESHDFGEGARYYEHIFGHRHHDHLFCVICKKIGEFRSERIEALQDEAASELGFKVLRHTLAIFGVCDRCAETPKGRALLAEAGHVQALGAEGSLGESHGSR